jgi:hypothetical protein
MMIGQTVIKKASAAASQPATTAIPQGRNHSSTTATISPIEPTMTVRRSAGARQPSHRWYRVGGGMSVIAQLLPMTSRCAGILVANHRSRGVRLSPAKHRRWLNNVLAPECLLTRLFKEGGELLNCPTRTGLMDEITAGEFAVNLG